MNLIKKCQEGNPIEYLHKYLPTLLPEVIVSNRNGGNFTFPSSKLLENLKRISGTKRDMRKKFIKSARPTYTNNRIVNRAEDGLKFAQFDAVEVPTLQSNYTTPEIVNILLEKHPNSEIQDLNQFPSVEDILGTTETPILDTMPLILKPSSKFNIEAATKYLTEHAHNSTVGLCARYVRQALEAGGLNTTGHPTSAADYVNYMSKLGFSLVSQNSGNSLPKDYTPLKGDVIVIDRVGRHKHGHIAMYNGQQWISDFKLKSFKVYDTINNYTIWRHN